MTDPKVHNIKRMAQTLLFLEEHNLRDYDELAAKAKSVSDRFAEITEQIACNTEALAFTKSMLPKTYEAYQNIITATVRGYK